MAIKGLNLKECETITLQEGGNYILIPEKSLKELILLSDLLNELGLDHAALSPGKVLKIFRLKHDLSVDALAKTINISRQTLASIETEKVQPNSKTVTQLADFFGENFSTIFAKALLNLK